MAHFLPDVLFEISGQAPPPNKNFYHFFLTKSEVSHNIFNGIVITSVNLPNNANFYRYLTERSLHLLLLCQTVWKPYIVARVEAEPSRAEPSRRRWTRKASFASNKSK